MAHAPIAMPSYTFATAIYLSLVFIKDGVVAGIPQLLVALILEGPPTTGGANKQHQRLPSI